MHEWGIGVGEYVFMVLMAILWAGAFVSGKLSVASVSPEVVAFLRFLVAGLALVAVMAVRNRKALGLARRDLPLALALGVTGVAGYNLLFFRGLRLSLASDGAMIVPTLNPLLTLFAAAIVLGEPLTARKLSGAGIALVGQVLLFWTLVQAAAHDPARLLGDLYYLASAVLWSAYTILGRIASKRFSPMASTTIATALGAVMLLPFALWQYPGSTGYTLPFWGHILYLALGATVGAFFLWSRGIEQMGASRTAVFVNLIPVFTVILAALFLGERPTLVQIAGMFLVLGGVFLAGSVRRPSPAISAAD